MALSHWNSLNHRLHRWPPAIGTGFLLGALWLFGCLGPLDESISLSYAQNAEEAIHQGQQAFRNQDYAEAQKHFEEALKDLNTTALANYWLGILDYAQGKRALAQTRFQLAYQATQRLMKSDNDFMGSEPSGEHPLPMKWVPFHSSIRLEFPATLQVTVLERDGWAYHPKSTDAMGPGSSQVQNRLNLDTGSHYRLQVTSQRHAPHSPLRWVGLGLLAAWLIAR